MVIEYFSTFLHVSCIVLAVLTKYTVDTSLHLPETGLCSPWAPVPCCAPAQGLCCPGPKGRQRRAGQGQHQHPGTDSCLACGNFLLTIIRSGTDSDVNTWSTKPGQCNSRTAFQRGMLANTENLLVGEKFVEERVFRKDEPAQLAVAANSGSSWSWTSLTWASEYLWLLPFVFWSGISRGVAFVAHTKGNTNHREEVSVLQTAEEQFL